MIRDLSRKLKSLKTSYKDCDYMYRAIIAESTDPAELREVLGMRQHINDIKRVMCQTRRRIIALNRQLVMSAEYRLLFTEGTR